MNYYDYFPEEEHMDEDVPMDEFIAEATRTDIRFQRGRKFFCVFKIGSSIQLELDM